MDSEVFLGDINPSYPEGGRNYHPLSENCDFSGPEPPLDLRPVCKFKFVRCGAEENNQSALFFYTGPQWTNSNLQTGLRSNGGYVLEKSQFSDRG